MVCSHSLYVELFRLKSEPTAQEAIDLNKQYKEKVRAYIRLNIEK